MCEYELICETTPPRPLPFPPCVHTSWGPGDSAAKYSLVPLQKGAIFCTVNGLAEVRFQMPKELRFTAKVKSNDRDEKALSGYIMNRVVGSNAVFTFRSENNNKFTAHTWHFCSHFSCVSGCDQNSNCAPVTMVCSTYSHIGHLTHSYLMKYWNKSPAAAGGHYKCF